MKILVIRFSSIGDILLTTPVVRVLKTQLEVEIHYLTKHFYTPLLDLNPYVDHLHQLQDRLPSLYENLRKLDFDFIVDLHANLRSFRLKQALSKRSRSFKKMNIEKWLMVNFKIDFLSNRHIVDRYLDSVSVLGVENDGRGLDAYYRENKSIQMPKEPYVVLAMGGAHQTKKLPPHALKKLCALIDVPIAVIGGKEDAAVGQELSRAYGHITNYAGELNLHGSAQLIDYSKLVISHDTGMMHLAASLKKPVISIWGNTIPKFGMFPYYPRDWEGRAPRFEVDVSCRPCSKIGYSKCPKGHFRCMEDQDLEAIARTCGEFFNQ